MSCSLRQKTPEHHFPPGIEVYMLGRCNHFDVFTYFVCTAVRRSVWNI